MTRTQLAGYGLLCTTFILAALLVIRVDARLESEAQAAMVIAQENFTLMTAKSRNNEEALFILDNSNARLLIYRLNVGRKALENSANEDMAAAFQQASRASGGGGSSGR